MLGSDSLIGRTFSHYRILESPGNGGMGVVYKAKDTRMHRFVAITFLPEDLANNPSTLERFHREATAASAAGACSTYEVLDWVGAGERSPLASPSHLLPLLSAHTLIPPAGYVVSRLFQFETTTRQREGFVQDSVYSEAARVDRSGDDELDDGLDQDRR